MPKNKYREIAEIGIPAVMESLAAVIITTIDTKMISGLGSQALSAVSLTTQPKLIFFCVFYALGTTVSIFTSQALGRKDAKEGNTYFHLILRVTVLLSLILGIGAAVFARPIMMVCNRQPDTVEMSVSFLLTRVFSLGIWGIWAASLVSQITWFVMSCILERRTLNGLAAG